MLRSMFAGVSGLRSHQTFMDTIGNNIANVNTTGYKASQVVFTDLLSQTIAGAGAGNENTGGTNPAQIGLGVSIGAIRGSFTQGANQLTNRVTDLAIQGDGFFAAAKNGRTFYTRAGSFSFDAAGHLTAPNGAIIQGWLANPGTGTIDNAQAIENLRFPLNQTQQPKASDTVEAGGILPPDTAVASKITSSIPVFDVLGRELVMGATWTKTAAGWDFEVTNNSANPATPIANTTHTFDPVTGVLTSEGTLAITKAQLETAFPDSSWGGAGLTINFGADTATGLRSLAGANTAAVYAQNGYRTGHLQAFSIGTDGMVTGAFSNGQNKPLGQVALALFNNPAGLEKVGDSFFATTVNSGNPALGVAGAAGIGTLDAGTLEMSNVELAQEFTNLVIAQRGFQANSRIISASDSLLGDLVNMSR